MTQRRLIPVSAPALAFALAITLGLAACDQTPPPEPAPPFTPSIRMALGDEGLVATYVANGQNQPLPFSRLKAQTLVTMTRVEAAPGAARENKECGAGPLTFAAWPTGLTLVFQGDRFVGWTVDKPGLKTPDGIGVGSTRAELVKARSRTKVAQSTLGTEFTAGGVGGLLDGQGPDAKVTNLWAGVTCMFR